MSVDPETIAAPPHEEGEAAHGEGSTTDATGEVACGASAAAWEDLLGQSALEAFCRGWLAIQSDAIGGVQGALVCWQRIGDAKPVRLAEASKPVDPLLFDLVTRSLEEGRGLAVAEASMAGRVALSHVVPLPRGARAVVAVDVARADERAWPKVLRQLQWGAGWLESRLRAELRGGAESMASGPAADVLDLLAVAIEARGFDEAAHAVVTELAAVLRCDRVSLGLEQRGHIRVAALSHSADFGRKMNLLVAIGAAMDEARDQGAVIHLVPGDDAAQAADAPAADAPARATIRREHERLRREHGASAVLTVPIDAGASGAGALTFESTLAAGFDADQVRFATAVAAALGPLLALRQRDDRSLAGKAVWAFREQAVRLLGPGHLGRKLVALAAVSLSLFFSLATGDYRISADGVLEGSHRRVIVAPFDGYVGVSDLRAGDLVREGDVLAQLDDRDLRLEQLKWASRLAQYQRQYDEARAERERAQVRILAAQLEEAEAEMALIEERIERTRVVAPFDGLIVSGDLTQALGAAVERGDVLFELAPLDRYRVLLEVDETQIGDIELGQRGRLLLAAMPDEPLPFEVTKLTPIAKAEEGANRFQVEGVLDEVSDRLRPGMEGVGKVEIGARNLFWIWTRGVQSWARLALWSVWP